MSTDDHHPESGKRADPQIIIDRIQRELDRLDLDVDLEEIDTGRWDWNDPGHRAMIREAFGDDGDEEAMWPGYGPSGAAENARDDCGQPHPFVCESCGHTVEFGRTCAMSVCTRCARVWARDTGIRKSAKIQRVRKEQDWSIDSLWAKEHHLVLSPPPAWYYALAEAGLDRDEAQEVTKEVVKDVLDEMRAQGLLVRHSYRTATDDGDLEQDHGHGGMGLYKDLLFQNRPWEGEDGVRDRLAWKPHYHGIVVCDFLNVQGHPEEGLPILSEIVEDATGWVLHRIENDEGESLPNDGAMAGAVTYSISHADIMVREGSSNRSAIWEVGAFEGDPIRSSGRFTPQPHDLDWAEGIVRRKAQDILGIKPTTTDCGANIPDVEDPDLLAKKIIEELYPDDEVPVISDAAKETALHHVAEGNLVVDVETTDAGGGTITVYDAEGNLAGAGSVDLPGQAGTTDLPLERRDLPRKAGLELGPSGSAAWDPGSSSSPTSSTDGCDCGDDHGADDVDEDPEDIVGDDDRDDQDGAESCNGTLIPLDEARRRGLLDDPEWVRDAPRADEALAADREWLELDPWRAESPASAAPSIG